MFWRKTLATLLLTVIFAAGVPAVSFAYSPDPADLCACGGFRGTRNGVPNKAVYGPRTADQSKAQQQFRNTTPVPRQVTTAAPNPMPEPNKLAQLLYWGIKLFDALLGYFR